MGVYLKKRKFVRKQLQEILMKTLLLQSDNPLDLRLVLDLAKRLGMRYTETEQDLGIEIFTPTEHVLEQEDDLLDEGIDTSALYEGLNLSTEIKIITLNDLEKNNDLLLSSKYTPDFESAKEVFGAWEEDENETLEELLNMLTR